MTGLLTISDTQVAPTVTTAAPGRTAEGSARHPTFPGHSFSRSFNLDRFDHPLIEAVSGLGAGTPLPTRVTGLLEGEMAAA